MRASRRCSLQGCVHTRRMSWPEGCPPRSLHLVRHLMPTVVGIARGEPSFQPLGFWILDLIRLRDDVQGVNRPSRCWASWLRCLPQPPAPSSPSFRWPTPLLDRHGAGCCHSYSQQHPPCCAEPAMSGLMQRWSHVVLRTPAGPAVDRRQRADGLAQLVEVRWMIDHGTLHSLDGLRPSFQQDCVITLRFGSCLRPAKRLPVAEVRIWLLQIHDPHCKVRQYPALNMRDPTARGQQQAAARAALQAVAQPCRCDVLNVLLFELSVMHTVSTVFKAVDITTAGAPR